MATVFESLSLKGIRPAHLSQLYSYIKTIENDGWYSGNRKQFNKRHKELKEWIEDAC